MKKMSILFDLVFLFVIFISCEQQDEINSSKSNDLKVSIDQNSQIALEPTILTKDQILDAGCTDPVKVTFYAGQHIDIGDIIITNDETNLYVTYDLEKGKWWLKETHLFVGAYHDIPFTGSGNPKIGHFPYHGDHSETQSYSFTIPLSDITMDPDDCFVIIAHAAVVQKENGEDISSETAFGFGENKFPGNRWGWYFNYCEQKCDEEDDCLDAFAHNTQAPGDSFCFFDDGFKQWGWTNKFAYQDETDYVAGYSYKLILYASSFQCDSENNMEVGYIDLYIQGGDGQLNADIKYVLTNDNYRIKETNLYIGSDKYPVDQEGNSTVSPSEYTYSVYNLNVDTYLFEDIKWPLDTYIIPYAKICPVEVMPLDP